ncbi:BgTH12-05362 [Blumeria graminis f. sp. triticale]|uniref:BgtE-20062 n=3 Tax=Blumeria graminis TaxID=34373 RepID=A0A381L2U1_BLUGR|nr:BgTH12-05362 [Blumeria graminis f. sp. triticale]VDB88247.1 BgtE-20062 [Blumeria graminis f. sp. tritici]
MRPSSLLICLGIWLPSCVSELEFGNYRCGNGVTVRDYNIRMAFVAAQRRISGLSANEHQVLQDLLYTGVLARSANEALYQWEVDVPDSSGSSNYRYKYKITFNVSYEIRWIIYYRENGNTFTEVDCCTRL